VAPDCRLGIPRLVSSSCLKGGSWWIETSLSFRAGRGVSLWPPLDVRRLSSQPAVLLLCILNIITKSRLSSLNLVTVPKMPHLSLTPLKPSCHPQHDIRDAVLKYAISLLNK